MRKQLPILATIGVLALVLAALIIGPAAQFARAADHLDAPLVKTDGRIDINDLYVFHPASGEGQDLSKTVLVMTVNPAAGVISGEDFHPGAQYDFHIDKNGDAVADVTVRATFSAVNRSGSQTMRVDYIEDGKKRQIAAGLTETVIEGKDGRGGASNGVRAFGGLRDDPFFFDLASFNDGATFCEPGDSDFFLGLDVSAIVVELPTEWLSDGAVGVWAATSIRRTGQADRMGRPGINTVFVPPNPFEPSPPDPALEDAFNFGQPKDDQANFRDEIVDTLTLLYSLNDATDPDPSDDAATIQALADILLPDILTVDLSVDTGFLNGRNLADDVIDAELGLITEGLITTDCVDNNSTFLSDFPYLGVPND